MNAPTPTTPTPGERILWRGLEMVVTRVERSTVSGAAPMVYARRPIEVDEGGEEFIPPGEWSCPSRLQMSDLERAEADRDEARAEALRLREFINSAIPELLQIKTLSRDLYDRKRLDAVVKAAREALEVQS